MDWLLIYILIGLFVGLIAGLFGIGGGTTIVPLLVLTFIHQGFNNEELFHLALGTSLASIVITSISSIYNHNKKKAINWQIVKDFWFFLTFGTICGTFIAGKLNTKILSVFFVIFISYVAYTLIFEKKQFSTYNFPIKIVSNSICVVVGVVSSLVGAGGGVMTIPLMLKCGEKIRNAIATSATLGFPIALAGSVGFFFQGLFNSSSIQNEFTYGYIYFPAFIGIVIGSFFTVPIGVKIAHKINAELLKKLFGILLLILSLRVCFTVLF